MSLLNVVASHYSCESPPPPPHTHTRTCEQLAWIEEIGMGWNGPERCLICTCIVCTVKFGVYTYPPCTLLSFQMGGRGWRLLRIRTKTVDYAPMYHFCVRICIQLQHKPLSTHQWYKQWGGCMHRYKSPFACHWR